MSEKAGRLLFLLIHPLYNDYILQPFPEADHIAQTFQANFDRMLCTALEKYHSCPGFPLLLGSISQSVNLKYQSFNFPPGLVASLYLLRQEGYVDILDDTGFSGVQMVIATSVGLSGTPEFFAYFTELLENPE